METSIYPPGSLTIVLWLLILSHCFVGIEANSGSVYSLVFLQVASRENLFCFTNYRSVDIFQDIYVGYGIVLYAGRKVVRLELKWEFLYIIKNILRPYCLKVGFLSKIFNVQRLMLAKINILFSTNTLCA